MLFTEQGELNANVSGRFRFDVSGLKEFPAVGDWVAYEIDSGNQSAVIHHVLKRKSKFSRKVAGDTIPDWLQSTLMQLTAASFKQRKQYFSSGEHVLQ